MQHDIEQSVNEEFVLEGLKLTNLLVRNIDFSTDFAQSIEDKEIEQQRLERAQTEAQRRETEARGLAAAEIAQSGRREAGAHPAGRKPKRKGCAWSASKSRTTRRWSITSMSQNLSDNISIALVPSNSPFLFDFRSLRDAGLTAGVPGEN